MDTSAYLVDWNNDGKFISEKIATEDIITYGVIKTIVNNKCSSDNVFDNPNLNETIESPFGEKSFGTDYCGKVICAMHSGIFTYISEESAKHKASFANFAYGCEYFKAVKCVIPKGTSFYDASAVFKGDDGEDKWNPTSKYLGYLSDKIIIKEVI